MHPAPDWALRCCADLHPGNILVRIVDPNSTWGRIANFCRFKTAPHLVLLDVGMTCELSPSDQRNIVGFFQVCACSRADSTADWDCAALVRVQHCSEPAGQDEMAPKLTAARTLHGQ